MNKRRAIFILLAALALLIAGIALSHNSIGGVKASEAKDQGVSGFLLSITNFSIDDLFEVFLPLVSYSFPSPTPTPTSTPTPTNTPTPTPTATQPSIQPFTQCRNAGLKIFDGGEAVDTLTVTKSGRIKSMKVYLDITHPLVNDLSVTLEQNNTSKLIKLVNRPRTPSGEVCYGDDILVTLSDSASEPVDNACYDYQDPAISGEKKPYMLLGVYNDESMQGSWELIVRDEQKQFGEIGWLNVWCLEFTYTP